MAGSPRFFRRGVIEGAPPVDYLSPLAPWESPQYIPGAPGNLPGRLDRPSTRAPILAGDLVAPNAPDAAFGYRPLDGLQESRIFNPHHYARMISQPVFACLLGTPLRFLEINATRRNLLLLRNTNVAGNLFIEFGRAATLQAPLALAPGVMVLLDTVVPQDDLWVIPDAANLNLSFAYSVIGGM